MVKAAVPAALALTLGSPAFADHHEPAGALFVANKAEGSVSRIRLGDGREERRAPACKAPHELSLSPDGAHIAVGCYGGETIEILRSSDLEAVATIRLGEGARPHGVVWHDNGRIYASAEGRKGIVVVEEPLSATPSVREIASEAEGTHMIAVSTDGRVAWSADMGAGTVTRYDIAQGSRTGAQAVGREPEGIALAPDGRTLWVSVRGDDKLLALDPATLEIRREIGVGRFPLRVAISPDGTTVVTSNLRDGTVSLVDAESGEVQRTIRVSGAEDTAQVTLLFSPDGKRLYAAETQLSKVAEIDITIGEVVGRLAGGVGGDGLAIGE